MDYSKLTKAELIKEIKKLEKKVPKSKISSLRALKSLDLNLFNELPTAIFTVDRDGKVLSWNKRASEITGYSQKEAIGNSCKLFAESPCKKTCGLIDETKPDVIQNVKCTVKAKDGTEKQILKHVKKIRDSKGKLIGGIESFIDISKETALSSKLSKLENRYAKLFELSLDSILFVDTKKGIITDCNDSLCNLLEMNKSDIINKPLFSFIPKEDLADSQKNMQSIKKDGQLRFRGLLTKSDKSFVTVEVAAKIIDFKTGLCLAVARDITDEVKAQNNLRESETKHKTLFERSADGILLADVNTKKFIDANPKICEILGYSKEELVNMSVFDIHPKEALDQVISEFEAQAKGEKDLAENLPVLRKDGTTFYADINTSSAEIDGKLINFGQFRDVTKKLEAEKVLKSYSRSLEDLVTERTRDIGRNEAKFRTLIEKSSDIILMLNRDGNITYASPTIKDYDYSFEDVVDKPFIDIINPKHRNTITSVVDKCIECHAKNSPGEFDNCAGKTYQLSTFQIKKKDGSYRWIEGTIRCLFNNERINALVFNGHDVTSRKLVETQKDHLLLSLSSQNEDFLDLLFITSHDLRSPLFNISGFSNELRRLSSQLQVTCQENKEANDSISDIIESADQIQKSITLMDKLLIGINKLSSINEKRLKVTYFEPTDLVYKSIKSHEKEIKEKNIEVEIEKLHPIKADQNLINEVFDNLISNAVSYTHPEKTSKITVSSKKEGNFITFIIEDNGIGIHDYNLKAVFRPYFTNKVDARDKGLGLTICKRIVSVHNGYIWVESEPDKGSKFFFQIPS